MLNSLMNEQECYQSAKRIIFYNNKRRKKKLEERFFSSESWTGTHKDIAGRIFVTEKQIKYIKVH